MKSSLDQIWKLIAISCYPNERANRVEEKVHNLVCIPDWISMRSQHRTRKVVIKDAGLAIKGNFFCLSGNWIASAYRISRARILRESINELVSFLRKISRSIFKWPTCLSSLDEFDFILNFLPSISFLIIQTCQISSEYFITYFTYYRKIVVKISRYR